MDVVSYLRGNNIDAHEVVKCRSDEENDFSDLIAIDNYDFYINWIKNNGRNGRLRFKYTQGIRINLDEINLQGRSEPQFIVMQSPKDVRKSRIYRRGSVQRYCEAVAKYPGPDKIVNGLTEILYMTTYITLENFIPLYAKLQLSGYDFKDIEFWNMLRF